MKAQKIYFFMSVLAMALAMALFSIEAQPITAQGPNQGPRPTPQPNFLKPTPTPPLNLKTDLEQRSEKLRILTAAPLNDDFDSAIVISSFPYTHTLDTTGATVAPDDPNMGCGAGVNSNTVWYRFTAPSAGRIRAHTFGSNYDTVLAAFTGSRGALTSIACNDDTSTLQSEIIFRVQSGITYYLEAADYGSPGGGQLELTIEFTPTSTIDVPIDIVLVQDETGSMGDDIGSLRNLAPQIWDSIAGISTAGFRMSVVGFRDFARSPWGDYGDWVYRLIADFTTSRDQFVAAVNALTAYGGYDEPESQYATLYYLMTTSHPCIDSNGDGDCLDSNDTPAGQQPSFRSGARRIILLATDAPFHDPKDTPGYPGPTRDAVVNALVANRAIVIGIVPGGAGRLPEVDDLASVTGGSTQDTGSSGHDVADAIAAALGQIRPVSPDLSTIQASPASVSADGITTATITVTLRDTASNPVANKTVLLYSDRGGVDVISQPSAPTGANGQTTGTIRSFTPGTSHIYAIDVTDNVQVTQQATVQFTGEIIPPNEELRRQIDRLYSVSDQQLGNLALTAQDAGAQGDYFRGAIGADRAKQAVDVFNLVVGYVEIVKETEKLRGAVQLALPGMEPGWSRILSFKNAYSDAGILFNVTWQRAIQAGDFSGLSRPILMGGMKYYAAKFLHKGIEELVEDEFIRAWRDISASSDGLTRMGNSVATDMGSLRQDLKSQHDTLVAGIPPMSDTLQSAYADELRKRIGVPIVLGSAQSHQAWLLDNLRAAHESVRTGGLDLFILKFAAKTLSYSFPSGPLIVHGFISALDTYLDTRKLDVAQRAYNAAPAILKGSAESAVKIYMNEASGFERVSSLLPPRPVTGQIGDVWHYSEGSGWGVFWKESLSYSDIEVTNTSSETASFEAIVQYGYNSRLLGLPWAYIPLIQSDAIVLESGQTGTLRIYYKQEERGGSPDKGSFIGIDILATNATGTFYIGHKTETWNPQRVGLSGVLSGAEAVSADAPTIENPIDVYVISNPSDQTYQAQIWIANPFTSTISANITQTLPSGVTMVTSDGTLNGTVINWQKTIAASDIVSATFTFRFPAMPGSTLSLPPAAMGFFEPSSGQVLRTESNTPIFPGLWPVTIEGYAPLGKYGTSPTMPITVTNLVDQSVNGSITVVISDTTGTQIYSNTQPFNVSNLSSRVLTFTLPGDLRSGFYPIEIWLSVNGTRERMWGDTYQVLGYEFYLPLIIKGLR